MSDNYANERHTAAVSIGLALVQIAELENGEDTESTLSRARLVAEVRTLARRYFGSELYEDGRGVDGRSEAPSGVISVRELEAALTKRTGQQHNTSKTYRLLDRGSIPGAFKDGGRWIIPGDGAERYIRRGGKEA